MATRVLTRLGRLNTTAVFLTATVLVLAGLFIGGWAGAAILLAIGVLPTTILVRIWAHLDAKAKAARIAMIAILVMLAVIQVTR